MVDYGMCQDRWNLEPFVSTHFIVYKTDTKFRDEPRKATEKDQNEKKGCLLRKVQEQGGNRSI